MALVFGDVVRMMEDGVRRSKLTLAERLGMADVAPAVPPIADTFDALAYEAQAMPTLSVDEQLRVLDMVEGISVGYGYEWVLGLEGKVRKAPPIVSNMRITGLGPVPLAYRSKWAHYREQCQLHLLG